MSLLRRQLPALCLQCSATYRPGPRTAAPTARAENCEDGVVRAAPPRHRVPGDSEGRGAQSQRTWLISICQRVKLPLRFESSSVNRSKQEKTSNRAAVMSALRNQSQGCTWASGQAAEAESRSGMGPAPGLVSACHADRVCDPSRQQLPGER